MLFRSRDDETGFAPILRSTRVRKTDYLVGRFLGASLVSALVCLAIPLGILVGSAMPWQDPEKIGPLALHHYGYAVVVFGIPSQLAIGGCFFALATATRSMMWTYVGLVGFLVAYTVSRILLRSDDQNETVSVLMDPFGLAANFRVVLLRPRLERQDLDSLEHHVDRSTHPRGAAAFHRVAQFARDDHADGHLTLAHGRDPPHQRSGRIPDECGEDRRVEQVRHVQGATRSGFGSSTRTKDSSSRSSFASAASSERDRKSTRLNSSHIPLSRMPSSA